MKSQTSIKHIPLILAGVVLMALTGCNSVDPAQYQSVKLPPPMRYQPGYAADTYRARLASNSAVPAASTSNVSAAARPGGTISRNGVLAELRGMGVRSKFNIADNTYVIPDHDWVKKQFDPYFRWYIYYLSAEYHAEGMDCDNYSDMYQQALILANLKAGGTRSGDVPCAVLVVNQRDKGILHALNLVRTNKGWYIVEPQDGLFIPLSSYRYKNDIAYVDF